MSYQVLARKWRPKNFKQVIGQAHVLRALVNGLNQGRLHHAYLFTGTRGVGKTTLARILAKCLNCQKGVTAEPCSECNACQEIDEGRFVDLIEVDAASRTKVEDTRELLENVQYAPTAGRYKVYLIDEVHMLSGHSFNALLKTLEEPPPHVKFLLATTDPQKLPVTVLSRCLQFNLKRMSVQMISGHLGDVSKNEGIEADKTALNLLAQAADGSMRDALSLLDQAIAFSNGKVLEAAVSDMLGTIPKGYFSDLVSGLVKRDAIAVMEAVAGLEEQSVDFQELLVSLLSLLHQVALYQSVPKALDEEVQDIELISMLAQTVTPEDIQLYYQIALMGRKDLPLIPDPKAGLEMILLRMLSFQPLQTAALPQADLTAEQSEQPASVKHAQGSQTRREGAKATPVLEQPAKKQIRVKADDSEMDWPQLLSELGLKGVAYALASNLSFKSCDKGQICLVLEEQHAQIRTKNAEARLQKALNDYFSEDIRLRIDIEKHATETPSQRRSRNLAERQQAAEQAIDKDLVIQGLKKQFGAKIVPGSVKPLDEFED